MRVARFFSRLAVVALFVLTPAAWPATARADQGGPSPPDSTVTTPGGGSVFTIVTVEGERISAQFVEPWSMEMIRYRTTSGQVAYLADNKVRTIEDADGNKRLNDVLVDRKQLGPATPGENRSFGAWLLKPAGMFPDHWRRDYFVAEFGFANRVDGGAPSRAAESILQTGLGWMKNLSPRWAVGGVFQLASNVEDYHFVGLGARLRRYISDYWSLEGTLGAFGADYGYRTHPRGVPVFGEVGVTALGSVTVFTRLERHHYSYQRYVSDYPTAVSGDTSVSEEVLRFGLRFGPRPRALAIPMAIAGTMIILSDGSPRSTF